MATYTKQTPGAPDSGVYAIGDTVTDSVGIIWEAVSGGIGEAERFIAAPKKVTIAEGGEFNVDSGTGSAAAGAVTLNKMAGVITSEALTTAQNATYTLTLTNSQIAAADIVLASLANGTNTQGTPIITRVTPAAGSVVILVKNMHDAIQALNGTIKISFLVVKA